MTDGFDDAYPMCDETYLGVHRALWSPSCTDSEHDGDQNGKLRLIDEARRTP